MQKIELIACPDLWFLADFLVLANHMQQLISQPS
jgi:hypothetical protein